MEGPNEIAVNRAEHGEHEEQPASAVESESLRTLRYRRRSLTAKHCTDGRNRHENEGLADDDGHVASLPAVPASWRSANGSDSTDRGSYLAREARNLQNSGWFK